MGYCRLKFFLLIPRSLRMPLGSFRIVKVNRYPLPPRKNKATKKIYKKTVSRPCSPPPTPPPRCQGHAPRAVSKGKAARFVHPKVSMAVGEKVGVGSLRRSMVNESLSKLDFGVGESLGESFGQQESLTRRLKHILQMYPEGPRCVCTAVVVEKNGCFFFQLGSKVWIC